MKLRDYLGRIEYDGPIRPTHDVLVALHAAHLRAVPFENLDVQLGRPLVTDVEPTFEKIVRRGRGGWCYEQNGLFGWALSRVCFEVTRLAATVMRDSRTAFEANHLCLKVRVPEDGQRAYLADVGFGGSMLVPIVLEESEHDQLQFRVGLRRAPAGGWQFWEDSGKGEFTFDFADRPADEGALSTTCERLQHDPDSGFVLNLVCQTRVADRQTSLRGRVLTTLDASGRAAETIATKEQLVETLSTRFGLDVPETATLWPQIVRRHEDVVQDRS